jgi:DNA invertase Pin-like site-specific DNA recombinase
MLPQQMDCESHNFMVLCNKQTLVCLLQVRPMNGKFVAYYRVSTDRQGRSGLGLEAQQKAVSEYLNGGDWQLVGQFTEIETGNRNDRPELEKALAICRKQKAKLVIAKLDRLSRNLAFIATLMDAGAEFIAVDNPHANKLTIHILAAVAQHERELIAERTRAALQAAKNRGVKLGRNGAESLAPTYRAEAATRATTLAPLLTELKGAGLSARRIAAELTARRVPTPAGGRWHAQTVLRVMRRASI